MMKEHYSYDIQGRLKSMISFDTINGKWLNHLKTDYDYSRQEHENTRIEITSEGKGSGWTVPVRSTFLLDSKSRDQSSISEIFDSATSKWMLLNKGQFVYVGDQIYQKAYVKPDSTGWKNEDQTLYIYTDTLGESLLSKESFYNWKNNTWKISQKTIYYYSGDKRISYVDMYFADKTTGLLKSDPDTRHIFSYDTLGNLIERKIQRINNGLWEDKFRRKSIWGFQ
jgi:hypothetical protein